MENKLKYSVLLAWIFAFSACVQNLDFTGYVYSTQKIDERFKQSEVWNNSHQFKQLTVASENYQLLVAGDSHIGSLRNFKKLVKEAQKPENLGFVIVGDIVTGHKEDYDALNASLHEINTTPYFLLVGNHDLFFSGWDSFYKNFGSSTYLFSIKTPTFTDLYICLDSGSGMLGAAQLQWLKNVLKTMRPMYRNCIVFSHVNFFRNRHTLSTNPLVDEIYVLMDLFARYDVKMVISGHDHVRSLNEFGNTMYITMDALLDTLPSASILKINVNADNATYSFLEINSIN